MSSIFHCAATFWQQIDERQAVSSQSVVDSVQNGHEAGGSLKLLCSNGRSQDGGGMTSISRCGADCSCVAVTPVL